jgi:transposase InsO family protein
MSVRLAVTHKVVDGEWSVEEAAEAIGFSPQTIRRWVYALPYLPERAEESAIADLDHVVLNVSGVSDETTGDWLTESVRKVLDCVMDRRLRRRSLQEYVRRHHGLDLNRQTVARYLREKGLCGPAAGTLGNTGSRRFEAVAPMELIQADIFYIHRTGGGFFYGISVLDDHSRIVLGPHPANRAAPLPGSCFPPCL